LLNFWTIQIIFLAQFQIEYQTGFSVLNNCKTGKIMAVGETCVGGCIEGWKGASCNIRSNYLINS